MWNRKLGFIEKDVLMLGTPEVPVYLIRHGKTWTLVEGGLTTLTPRVLGQLLAMVEDLSTIKSWVITHAHYDHCGMLSTLYPFLPDVRVYASPKTADAFKSSGAQRVIRHLNNQADALWGLVDNKFSSATPELLLGDIPIMELDEGDAVELGTSGSLVAMSTPGHSACSMSFYEPSRGWLFAGDAMGELQQPGHWCPLVFDDFGDYRASLEAISNLRLNSLFLGHHGSLNEKEARNAPMDALQAAYQFKAQAGAALSQGQESLIDFVVGQSSQYAPVSQNFVSRDLHYQSMLKMARLLTSEIENSSFPGRGFATSEQPLISKSFKTTMRRSA
jgi:2-aminobenzoylacetyl-CoA thioesterase